MSESTLLVTSETRFVRGPDGVVRSSTGVDGYAFWTRYLDVFDRVVVAARTAIADGDVGGPVVEGPGVRVAPLPDYRGPWGWLRVRPLLVRALRDAVLPADALCLRAPGPLATTAWKLRDDRPTALEVVGDPYDSLAPGAVRGVVRPFARARLVRDLGDMARAADGVAYVTEHALQRRYPPRGWTTSYSSIDLEDCAFVTDDVARSRERRAPWRLVFVGTLAQLYKAPDVLIDAVAQVAAGGLDVRLTLVGGGAYQDELAARAELAGVAHRVAFAGQVAAGAAVREVLDRAHLFVLPSRQEGLPRAMIEAMARGVPCVGSTAGGIPELLPPERLVPSGDARALAETIARLCGDPAALAAAALRDLGVARRYRGDRLRERRRAFYARLRAAAEARPTRWVATGLA